MASARAPRATIRSLRAKARAGTATAKQIASIRKAAKAVGTRLGLSSRDVSPEQKAIYHDVTGAGRRHVIRHFFGFTAEDKTTLEALLRERILARVQAS